MTRLQSVPPRKRDSILAGINKIFPPSEDLDGTWFHIVSHSTGEKCKFRPVTGHEGTEEVYLYSFDVILTVHRR